MERTAVNPWDWSLKFGFNQAEVITGVTKHVICSGQTAVDDAGAPQHIDDMRAQISLALDNLEAVLQGAGLELRHVVKLNIHATDMAAAMENFDLLGMRFGPHGVKPPMTLLGVSALALPGLMFEIEATAMA